MSKYYVMKCNSSPLLTAASLCNRSAYKKLLSLLGDCGQAEITSLEAD